MPVKNKDQENLNSYKVHFSNKETETFHLKDDLLQVLAKADEGGFHPIVVAKGEWAINLENVNWIENVTPIEPKVK